MHPAREPMVMFYFGLRVTLLSAIYGGFVLARFDDGRVHHLWWDQLGLPYDHDGE